jgi:hypothetical protein
MKYTLEHPNIVSGESNFVVEGNFDDLIAAKKMWIKMSKLFADGETGNREMIFTLKNDDQLTHYKVIEKSDGKYASYTIDKLNIMSDTKEKINEFTKKVFLHLDQTGGRPKILEKLEKIKNRVKYTPRFYFSPSLVNHIVYSIGIANPSVVSIIQPMPDIVIIPPFYRQHEVYLIL